MKIIVLLVACCSAWAGICAPASGFAHCQTLVVDHTKVPGTLANYPALVCFDLSMGPHCLKNDKQLATTANGGFLLNLANGFDFIFTSDAGGTMTLAYESKFHNITTGAAELWVNIPSLSSSADTTIYLFYGKVAITTDQSNVSGTWDANFLTVHHFDFLSGAQTTITDTKGNASFAAADLSNCPPSCIWSGPVTGSAGEGLTPGAAGAGTNLFDFNHGGFSVGIKSYSGLPTGANPRTVECWPATFAAGLGTGIRPIWSYGGTASGAAWSLMINRDMGGTDYVGAGDSFVGPNSSFVGRTATGILDGTFHQVAITFPSGGSTYADSKVYIDGATGAPDFSFMATTAVNSTSVALVMACSVGTGAGSCANVYEAVNITSHLDECRVSNVERTANWLKTEYNNISNPSTFFKPSNSAQRTIIVN